MKRILTCLTAVGIALGLAMSVPAATIDLSVSTVEELTNALATVSADTANNYTITLAAKTYDLTAVTPMHETALLNVSIPADWRTLTIQGDPTADREDVVLDAKEAGRVIRVYCKGGSCTCTFKHLTLANGKGGDGSAVYIASYSTYCFRDCVFRGNKGAGGGALTSANSAHLLKFYDCLVENCYITGTYGGSLFTHATWLQGCTFRGNTNNCDQSTSLIALASGSTVTNCVFAENAVPGRWSTGGVLRMAGGKVLCCAFTNNVANAGGGGGGALILAGKTDVRNCTFYGNRYTPQNSYGGAVYSTSAANTNAVISGCTFEKNYASSSGSCGGALASFPGRVRNCTFIANTGYYGGAVYNCTNVVDCVFAGNRANGITGENGGGAAYKSVICDSVVTNNTSDYQAGGFYDCRVYRSVIGHNSCGNPLERTQEGMVSYYEDCELIGGSPFGTCFNSCGFNRCYLHDYCSTNAVLGAGYGYFIGNRIAITNCLFKNIYCYRFINGYQQNFNNVMVNSTLVDCTYNILSSAGECKEGTISMLFLNNLFWGIKTKSWASDDAVGQLSSTMSFTNNFLYTSLKIGGSGNLNSYTDATLKPKLMLERDPEHPYAPRRRSVLVGAGLVQDWMTDAVDLAGQERLTDGKVAIGAYETTDRGPFPGLLMLFR